MEGFKVRLADAKDSKTIVDLQIETFKNKNFPHVFCHPDYEIDPSYIKTSLAYEKEAKYLLLERANGQKAVGYSVVYLGENKLKPALIADVATSKGFSFLGEDLVRETEKLALTAGFNRVSVAVNKRNKDAVKGYKNMGYDIDWREEEKQKDSATPNKLNLIKKLG